ncbi:MAG: S8 family serine peptidase, partial [Campylobacterota bacterium]
MFNRIFQTLLITFALLFIGCGSGGGSSSNTDQDVDPIDISEFDSDGDFIPDNIEIFLGTDSNESDENSNGVLDGLETTGIRGDTFFDKQWHIHSLGTETNYSGVATIVGNDLDILEIYHTYMGYNHGDNIIIQVVDTGVDKDHEDLISNMDISRSYNGDEVGDPSAVPDPPDYHYTHGTMVAGIMAAQAFNGKGVRGIIPFAKISGSNFLQNQSYESLSTAWLNGAGANEISVSNNSWGSYYDTDLFYEDLMEEGTKTLRDAKGRVYVFAAGNRREYKGNANLQYRLSNRYAIVVAALKHDNTHASYSNPGANILVSGYSGEYYQISPTIGTTTDMGSS